MKYRTAVAFRQALQDRLKADARNDPAQIVRNRKRVAFDRLLARLAVVAPGRWLLKGGFALDLRLANRARSTKDVDIDWRAGTDELYEALIEATEHDPGDFFVFAIERDGTPADRLGGSHRFHVSASLAARRFEDFLLDVGFRDDKTLRIETLATGDLLQFAGISPVTVEAVPVEQQIAEKLHAYARTYEGGRVSTRAKDLVDIVLIAELSELDAPQLRAAIDATFRHRDGQPAPIKLPAPPPEWAPQVRKLTSTLGIPSDLHATHRVAAQMVDPVLSGDVATGAWNPELARWSGR